MTAMSPPVLTPGAFLPTTAAAWVAFLLLSIGLAHPDSVGVGDGVACAAMLAIGVTVDEATGVGAVVEGAGAAGA